MATKGKEIHALDQKIRVIAEVFCELGKLRSGSRSDFANLAGLDYDALKTAWRFGRLSPDLEQKIADAAGFETVDPAWVDESIDPTTRGRSDDPAYPGRDTVSNFRSMLRCRLDLPGSGTPVRIVNERPQLIDRNLAAFSIDDSGQGATLGEPAPVFLSIIVERGYHPKGIEYGFRRMRFRFVFEEQSQSRIRRRLGESDVVEINGAALEVRGSEHDPEWFLHVEASVLEGEYASREHPLCVLEGFQLDEEFTAEISVRPMDGSLLKIDGSALHDLHKRRVIEHLCARRLPGSSDSQGWISLGRQQLRVIRADRT
jgi:hypothetical protein